MECVMLAVLLRAGNNDGSVIELIKIVKFFLINNLQINFKIV